MLIWNMPHNTFVSKDRNMVNKISHWSHIYKVPVPNLNHWLTDICILLRCSIPFASTTKFSVTYAI